MEDQNTVIDIHTLSESHYQIDTKNKAFRRVSGKSPPTARTGMDGKWKVFKFCYLFRDGLMVDWDGEGHSTLTNIIKNLDEVREQLGLWSVKEKSSGLGELTAEHSNATAN